MKRIVKFTVLAALSVLPLSAAADKAPWEKPRPAGMTAAHDKMAADAIKFVNKIGIRNFGNDPHKTEWDWKNGRRSVEPVSNLTTGTLQKMAIGNYKIYKDNPNLDAWSIGYYAPDGTFYDCYRKKSGRGFEAQNPYHIIPAFTGAAGLAVGKSPKYGWPVIYDPASGILTHFGLRRGKWYSYTSWFQEEYPAVAAEYCPNLPRKDKINTEQRGHTLAEIAQNARPIRGLPVPFMSDPKDPLTAEMLWWAYPPK
ncbi:hypothetical protein [Donghicola tyrosinivorans]|uniref:Uncharacterized protein n=1 Tax=Donghicola tyrosinivorans TaxID=1652492 RepID=A0A2T0WU94_9RHOB|nr:hypothetical protein [Donghicola tyrosinivorans]PRY90261.1 hypothetical protein CLV74_105242 [Donghicola tyrosinivorans]